MSTRVPFDPDRLHRDYAELLRVGVVEPSWGIIDPRVPLGEDLNAEQRAWLDALAAKAEIDGLRFCSNIANVYGEFFFTNCELAKADGTPFDWDHSLAPGSRERLDAFRRQVEDYWGATLLRAREQASASRR